MKFLPLFAFLLIVPTISHAANSRGKDSPIIVGTLESVAADGKSFTVKQKGNNERTLLLNPHAVVEYVGMPDPKERTPTVGYGVKAKVAPGGSAGDAILTIRFTQPLTPVRPLGPQRLTMTGEQLHAAADANHDGKLSYVEFAASIMRSEKHGPDHFFLADTNHDGSLSPAELTAFLPRVNWWKFSRQPAAAWFKAADKDGNGKIDIKEFEMLATAKNHVEKEFARADTNHDGTLDPAEVAAYLKGVIDTIEHDEE